MPGHRRRRVVAGLDRHGRCESRVVAQDAISKSDEVVSGVDAQLGAEPALGSIERFERFGSAPGAVEREHQLTRGALTPRMRGDQVEEFADDLVVPAAAKVDVDEKFLRRQPGLVQPAGGGAQPRRVQAMKGRTAPEAECGGEGLCRGGHLGGGYENSRVPQMSVELLGIQPARFDVYDIARAHRLDGIFAA